jgi:outer membrane murein-binding lipoprotein Lpp
VKNKKITGLSIEAYLKPVTNDLINMTKEELDTRIREVMAEQAPKKEYNVDKMEVGGIVTDAEGKPIKVEAVTIDGKMVTSGEDGVITAVEDPTEESAEGGSPDLQKVIDDLTAENNDLKAKIVEMENAKTQMSSEIEATKKVAMKMSEEIKAGLKPVDSGVKKSYSEMSNAEKTLFNRGLI